MKKGKRDTDDDDNEKTFYAKPDTEIKPQYLWSIRGGGWLG